MCAEEKRAGNIELAPMWFSVSFIGPIKSGKANGLQAENKELLP